MSLPGTSETAPVADQTRWFAEEVHPHNDQLKAYLRHAFPGVHDVDDIVQESFLRIWRARATRTIRSAKDFLFQIGRNVATDTLRRRRSSPIDAAADPSAAPALDPAPDAAEAVCTREELELLADAIAQLPARCREILMLRKLTRVPQKDIARQLGVSECTVQNQVARGVRRCEEYLAARGVRRSNPAA